MLKRGMVPPGAGYILSAVNSTASLAAEQKIRNKVEEMGGYLSSDFQDCNNPISSEGSASKPNSQPNSAHNTRPSSTTGEHSTAGQDAYTGPGQVVSRSGSVTSTPSRDVNPNLGVWVFIDIQLYMLETNNFMVDFKCDGYQNVLWDANYSSRASRTGNSSRVTSPATSRPASGFTSIKPGDKLHPQEGEVGSNNSSNTTDSDTKDRKGEWRPISKRIRNKEKEITSPYPYLDVASDLIAQLAVAN